MIESKETKLFTYELVDWEKAKSILPAKQIKATIYEASQLNKGFAMNGHTKRWVKQD